MDATDRKVSLCKLSAAELPLLDNHCSNERLTSKECIKDAVIKEMISANDKSSRLQPSGLNVSVWASVEGFRPT